MRDARVLAQVLCVLDHKTRRCVSSRFERRAISTMHERESCVSCAYCSSSRAKSAHCTHACIASRARVGSSSSSSSSKHTRLQVVSMRCEPAGVRLVGLYIHLGLMRRTFRSEPKHLRLLDSLFMLFMRGASQCRILDDARCTHSRAHRRSEQERTSSKQAGRTRANREQQETRRARLLRDSPLITLADARARRQRTSGPSAAAPRD